MQLVIAVVAHAVRQERRLFTGEGLERLSTWWVYKVQGRSVEEGSGARGASGTEDTAALATMVATLKQREARAAGKRVAAGRLPVRLPQFAREKDGQMFEWPDDGAPERRDARRRRTVR